MQGDFTANGGISIRFFAGLEASYASKSCEARWHPLRAMTASKTQSDVCLWCWAPIYHCPLCMYRMYIGRRAVSPNSSHLLHSRQLFKQPLDSQLHDGAA